MSTARVVLHEPPRAGRSSTRCSARGWLDPRPPAGSPTIAPDLPRISCPAELWSLSCPAEPCLSPRTAHYDVILKMRDNTVAVSKFAVRRAHAAAKARTKACVEWGGYNDKAMLIPRRYMDGALRCAPLRPTSWLSSCPPPPRLCQPRGRWARRVRRSAPSEDFFLTRGIGKGIPNSERLLRAVLDRNHVAVSKISAEALPLVDGRCSPQARTPIHTRHSAHCSRAITVPSTAGPAHSPRCVALTACEACVRRDGAWWRRARTVGRRPGRGRHDPARC